MGLNPVQTATEVERLGALELAQARLLGAGSPQSDIGSDRAESSQPSEWQLSQLAGQAEVASQLRNIALSYSIDSGTRNVVIRVVDRGTGEVIRQIPPQAIVSMQGRLRELMGLWFDEDA